MGIHSAIHASRTAFTAAALARRLKALASPAVSVSASSPAPLAKARNQFRFQIILRASATRAMARAVREALRAERLPDGVQLAVDIDAVSLL